MKVTERALKFERTLKELERALSLTNASLDEGSRHRLMDIANMIVDGRLTVDEAVEVWHQQPNTKNLNLRVRFWHSAISLRFACAKRGD